MVSHWQILPWPSRAGGHSPQFHCPDRLSFKMYRAGTASHAPVHPWTQWDAHTPRFSHTHIGHEDSRGHESPSLPQHQGCLFHRGDLVAHQHLVLQKVLGGQGDPGGPRRRRAIEHREMQTLLKQKPVPRPGPGHTHHLAHIPCLALLSWRSRQTL